MYNVHLEPLFAEIAQKFRQYEAAPGRTGERIFPFFLLCIRNEFRLVYGAKPFSFEYMK